MVRQLSTCLANGLMPRDCKLLGSPVVEYGKSALAGLDGKVKHGSAIVHFLSTPQCPRRLVAASHFGRKPAKNFIHTQSSEKAPRPQAGG